MKVYIIRKGEAYEESIIKVCSNLETAVQVVKECIEDMEESTYIPISILKNGIDQIEKNPFNEVWMRGIWLEITEHEVED